MKNNGKPRMGVDEYHIKCLCNTLKEMTLSDYFGDKTPSKISEIIFRWIHPIAVSTMLSLALFIVLAVIAALSSKEFSPKLAPWLGWIFALLFLEVIVCGLIVIYEVSRKSWLPYKKRYDLFLDIFEWYSIKDEKFLKILNKFELSTLNYVLIQYRQQWFVLRWKIYFWFILVLPFLAFGLLDAIVVDPPFVDAVDVGIVKSSIFFLISFVFYLLWLRMRPKQVIALLEYVIRLKSESQEYTSKPSPEPPINLRDRLGNLRYILSRIF